MRGKDLRVPIEEIERQREIMRLVRETDDRPQTYHIVTYGCQMNVQDSQKIAGMLEEMGLSYTDERESADFVIFNTCCVRDNAERRALGNVTWLNEIKKKNPKLLIGVCGCMIQQPQMADRILRQYPFIDLAFGTQNLYRFPELLRQLLSSRSRVVSVAQGDEFDSVPEGLPIRRVRHEQAFMTIMYGCNNFCTYCVVPLVRGRERSRKADMILSEAQELKNDGVREVMLLGQNVNSYGKDLNGEMSFPSLLRALDDTGIERLRFMTSHPKDLSQELIDVMAAGKHIMPHVHLPVQSGSDRILTAMNRHYTRAQYMGIIARLRTAMPEVGISTDIIVGFPGETDEDFEDTLSLVREARFDSAFTFVYSPRAGTKAAEMDCQIPPEISKARIEALIALQEEMTGRALESMIGKTVTVLVEGLSKRSENQVMGKCERGITVHFDGGESDMGSMIPVKITASRTNSLCGERI